jgi:hypothetical protein
VIVWDDPPFNERSPPPDDFRVDAVRPGAKSPGMTELSERLDSFEHRLRTMETELYELRRLARKEEEPTREPEAPLREVLEPPPTAAGGSVDTAFQRGHTAVSAEWAVVGLALLILGLKRSRALQVGGFALFGISLAKLFLYDLANLSSVTRAFSFVAVGMLIMVGGFFYQRMAALDSRT